MPFHFKLMSHDGVSCRVSCIVNLGLIVNLCFIISGNVHPQRMKNVDWRALDSVMRNIDGLASSYE